MIGPHAFQEGGPMADVRVTCITKPERMSSHEHITHLGGQGWTWPREAVIQSIDAKTNSFHVIDPASGRRAYVGIVRPTDGRAPFVQTYADGVWNNNLLALPECG
jgi:hypothetical protein